MTSRAQPAGDRWAFVNLVVFALAVCALDQAAKLLALRFLSADRSLPVIDGALQLTLRRNQGAAFGLFPGGATYLVLVGIVICLALLVFAKPVLRQSRGAATALALQLGGGLGNLIDRVRLQAVVDFIQIPVWPVFNLADVAITIGLIWLMIALFARR